MSRPDQMVPQNQEIESKVLEAANRIGGRVYDRLSQSIEGGIDQDRWQPGIAKTIE
jgi:hypothetical protein